MGVASDARRRHVPPFLLVALHGVGAVGAGWWCAALATLAT